MRIKMERTGGFAGIRVERDIDSNKLAPSEAKQLERLVRESHFFQLPAELRSPGPGTDRFHYRLTIESEKGARTVEAPEAAATGSLRELLHWIESLPR
jgi:hypothetical protein